MGYRRFQIARIDEQASDSCDSRDALGLDPSELSQKSQASQRVPTICAIGRVSTVAAVATVASPQANRTIAITSDDWLAHYEERAAMREFEGGLPRHEAEQLARTYTVTALGPPPQADGRKS